MLIAAMAAEGRRAVMPLSSCLSIGTDIRQLILYRLC